MNMNMMSQGLRIGDLVGRTGVAEPTLRMWERRHGFPGPTRTPSGHRRYTEDHVDQILCVLAGRMAGLSLKAAIERAGAVTRPGVSRCSRTCGDTHPTFGRACFTSGR
jgi:MerR-like DNA binding protein